MRVGGDEVQIKVGSTQTGGALLAIEVLMSPGGGPPGLHRHAPEEVYRIDRGQFTIHLEDSRGDVQRIVAGPGTVVHIPGGRMHTVRNESQEDASAYVVFTPGNEMERFVRAANRLAGAGPPEIAAVLALARRHGVEMAA
jgi:oxalate decarboxylase/phosphoglucose isomerase-like protein (cupin superfamily)